MAIILYFPFNKIIKIRYKKDTSEFKQIKFLLDIIKFMIKCEALSFLRKNKMKKKLQFEIEEIGVIEFLDAIASL